MLCRLSDAVLIAIRCLVFVYRHFQPSVRVCYYLFICVMYLIWCHHCYLYQESAHTKITFHLFCYPYLLVSSFSMSMIFISAKSNAIIPSWRIAGVPMALEVVMLERLAKSSLRGRC